MKYPEYKIEIKKISENNLNVKGFIHLGEGDYTESIGGFTISKKTAKEIIEILGDVQNIVSGKLKDINIDNGDDKVSFEYEGTEMKPRLYLYNDEHNENNLKVDGGILRIPLSPVMFMIKEEFAEQAENVTLLLNELKKYI
jgi:hypothetical protein